jgi:type IV secretory pathway ATPase VirB11/archaellum biosynthesis ATPase
MSNINNLINAIADGNAVETESSFNAAIAEKISARLDNMRASVAQSMFNQPEAVVEEEVQIDEEGLSEEEIAEAKKKKMEKC